MPQQRAQTQPVNLGIQSPTTWGSNHEKLLVYFEWKVF